MAFLDDMIPLCVHSMQYLATKSIFDNSVEYLVHTNGGPIAADCQPQGTQEPLNGASAVLLETRNAIRLDCEDSSRTFF